MSIKQYKRIMLPQLLNAAKSAIPRQWKDTESPSLRSWLCKINKTYNMECLRFSGETGEEGFVSRWKDWLIYRQSLIYAEKMLEGRVEERV